MSKRALVISGGGSKGAFAVGVLKHISTVYPQISFDIFVGTSTGALIVPMALTGEFLLLEKLYTTLNTEDIVTQQNVLNSFIDEPSLYDASPLAGLIAQYYEDNRAAEVLSTSKSMFLATVCLQTGHVVYFSNTALAGNTKDYDIIKMSSNGELRKAIMASSCQPVFMPPVEVQKDRQPIRQYVDGGVREYAGVQVAIDAGADEIFVIVLSPDEEKAEEQQFDSAFEILKKTIEIFGKDVDYHDISIPLLYNKALEYIAGVQQQMLADGISQAAIDKYFKLATPNPFADKKPLNIYIIRPQSSLGGGPGGLTFDPNEMSGMVAAGENIASQFMASLPKKTGNIA